MNTDIWVCIILLGLSQLLHFLSHSVRDRQEARRDAALAARKESPHA